MSGLVHGDGLKVLWIHLIVQYQRSDQPYSYPGAVPFSGHHRRGAGNSLLRRRRLAPNGTPSLLSSRVWKTRTAGTALHLDLAATKLTKAGGRSFVSTPTSYPTGHERAGRACRSEASTAASPARRLILSWISKGSARRRGLGVTSYRSTVDRDTGRTAEKRRNAPVSPVARDTHG